MFDKIDGISSWCFEAYGTYGNNLIDELRFILIKGAKELLQSLIFHDPNFTPFFVFTDTRDQLCVMTSTTPPMKSFNPSANASMLCMSR